MQPIRKPFEQDLYDRFDNPAKAALVILLERQGHTIPKLTEDYYADIVSTKDGVTHYSEAEVKRGWTSDWPANWAEIRIPERKSRLLKKYNYNVTFYVFNSDLTTCWCIKGSQMTKDILREAQGRYIREGEQFFHIPYTEAELISL